MGLKKIVLLKIGYSDGTSLRLMGEDAAAMIRVIDSLIGENVRLKENHASHSDKVPGPNK